MWEHGLGRQESETWTVVVSGARTTEVKLLRGKVSFPPAFKQSGIYVESGHC